MQPMHVHRRIGGAGTGKTQFILDEMDRVSNELRIGVGGIVFATFTKSGCVEMGTRAEARWGLYAGFLTESGNFRTVHSLAYRSLRVGRDQLLSDDSASLEWIGDQLGIDLAAGTDESGNLVYHSLSADGRDEAAALALWHLARTRLCSLDTIIAERLDVGDPVPPRETIEFVVNRYESAKRVTGRTDYCDMLLEFAGVSMSLEGPRICHPRGDLPEGSAALFVDECQDNSALVDMALMRVAHAPGMQRVILVGDPFQSIFESFAGGSSKHFMAWDASQAVMPRSYRCPEPVMALGERCLQEMSQGYWNRGILPASHKGIIAQAGSPVNAG